MTAPLFSVNEEVIVVPDGGGRFDAVVVGVKFSARSINIYTGEILRNIYLYQVSPDSVPEGTPWQESAIRKKPHPSSQSFDEIMQSIKRPVRVPA